MYHENYDEENVTPRDLVGTWPGAREMFDLLVGCGANENEAAIYVLSIQIGDKEKHIFPTVRAALAKINKE